MRRAAGLLLAWLAAAGPAVAQGSAAPQEPGPPDPPPVRYPLPFALRDLDTPGRPLLLDDLRLRVSDAGASSYAFAARARLGSWALLGVESEGERRALSLETARGAWALSAEDGRFGAFGSFRAPRWRAEADWRQRVPGEGRGVILGALVAGRWSPDLELVGRVVGDSAPQPPLPDRRRRFVRALALQAFYQRGTRFEAQLEGGRERVRNDAGEEYERDSWSAGLLGLVRGAELAGEAAYERSRGRFPRRQWLVGGSGRLPLGGRLLAEGAGHVHFEPGAKQLRHEYRGGLAWHARRYRLERTGAAARHTLELARGLSAAGLNERRVYDEDGRRALRERATLTRRAELREMRDRLYRAQQDERNLPVLGLELRTEADALSGLQARAWSASLGLPWPPAPPWARREEAAPFLTLRHTRERQRFSSALTAQAREWTLNAALHRELEVVVRWRRAERTPLDILRNQARPTLVELACLYSFGR